MWSLIGSAIRGLVILVVTGFALVGLTAVIVRAGEYYHVTWWSRDQLDPFFAVAKVIWGEAKNSLETLTWALAAFGLVAALGRLKTIAKLISDFRDSKGSIFELSSTITGVKETVTEVKASANVLEIQVSRLSDLAPVVTSTAEKLEDALKQLADLQRIVVSEQGPVELEQSADVDGTTSEQERWESNWQQLRAFWFANGERLDNVIERIPQARLRSRLRRMPRTDYPAIINALAAEGQISSSARDLSLKLHQEFLSHRSRKRPVTDSIVGAARVRDAILAEELGTKDIAPPPPGSSATDQLRKTEPELVH